MAREESEKILLTNVSYKLISSPVGSIALAADANSLLGLACEKDRMFHSYSSYGVSNFSGSRNSIIEETEEQLYLYFQGKLKIFNLPLAPIGTEFQRQVWDTLLLVPFGETISYAELAKQIGNPKGVRAVASAIGKNPIPIIIPCQRVIGSAGYLTGFASGLHVKRFLLRLEGLEIEAGATFEKDKISLKKNTDELRQNLESFKK